MRERKRRWAVLIACSALAAAACANHVEPAVRSPRRAEPRDSAVAGTLVLEQFLRAVNTRDIVTMSRLFGTRRGPIVDLYDRQQVDRRMLALAGLLEHEDYTIQRTTPAAGRNDGARQVIVRMKIRGRETDVPYTLVRSDAGSWLVEQIDLESVTGR